MLAFGNVTILHTVIHRFLRMRLTILFILCAHLVIGQEADRILKGLQEGGPLPAKILASRSVVLYSPAITDADIRLAHEHFVKTGIDAVAYFEMDRVFSGNDPELRFRDYFKTREFTNIIILQRSQDGYVITVTVFNGRENFIDPTQPVWRVANRSLKEALTELYRTALLTNKKQNLLLNDEPETGLTVRAIVGNRVEAFSYDLKVDKLAVPRFQDTTLNKALEEVMKLYPAKYELTDPALEEEELRKRGFYYVLRFVNARASVVRDVLSYEKTKDESAYTSVTYDNGEIKLKTIDADEMIYKFYFRKIDNGNVYLGTKWDADTTWQMALSNFILSFKAELKL